MKKNLLIYKIVIVILVLSLSMFMVTGISNLFDYLDDNDKYTFEEDHLSIQLRYNEYADLASAARLADVTNREVTETADLYLDAGRYYNAARNYHAYTVEGDTKTAARYLEEMNQLANSGNPYLEPHIADIKAILGITE